MLTMRQSPPKTAGAAVLFVERANELDLDSELNQNKWGGVGKPSLKWAPSCQD
jgi:hypothetical protein